MRDEILLLATNSDHLGAAARYLSRSTSSRETLIFVLFAVVILAIWMTIFLWDRLHRLQPAATEPMRSLFDELCQIHNLDRQEISGLVDAAQECRLPSPAELFVRPEHLARLSGDGLPKASVYKQLRDRLFGNL